MNNFEISEEEEVDEVIDEQMESKCGEADELDDWIVGRENKNSPRRKQHSYTKPGSKSQSHQ